MRAYLRGSRIYRAYRRGRRTSTKHSTEHGGPAAIDALVNGRKRRQQKNNKPHDHVRPNSVLSAHRRILNHGQRLHAASVSVG